MNRFPRDESGNPIDHVPGLEYYRDFLSPQEQGELLALIDANPWQEGVIARRQQFYGEVYYHTSFKSKVLQGCSNSRNDKVGVENKETNGGGDENRDNGNKSCICDNKEFSIESGVNCSEKHGGKSGIDTIDNANTDSNTNGNSKSGNGIPIDDSGMRKWLDKTMPLFEREGLMEPPTQILINEYKNNMGIASHFEDFDAFGPVILTVSLVSPVYMTLKKPTIEPIFHGKNSESILTDGISSNSNNKGNINACDTYDDIVKVLLEPGSLLVMKGDARYKYRHGIGKYKWVNLPPQPPPTTNQSSQSSADSAVAVRIKRDDSYRRVSLTVRHLLSTRRKVRENEDESDTIKDPSVY